MKELIEKKIVEYTKELDNTINAINKTEQDIEKLTKQGEQLAAKANFEKGKLESMKELLKESGDNNGTKAR